MTAPPREDIRDVDLRVRPARLSWDLLCALPWLVWFAAEMLAHVAYGLTVGRLCEKSVRDTAASNVWYTYTRRWPWQVWALQLGGAVTPQTPRTLPWSLV